MAKVIKHMLIALSIPVTILAKAEPASSEKFKRNGWTYIISKNSFVVAKEDELTNQHNWLTVSCQPDDSDVLVLFRFDKATMTSDDYKTVVIKFDENKSIEFTTISVNLRQIAIREHAPKRSQFIKQLQSANNLYLDRKTFPETHYRWQLKGRKEAFEWLTKKCGADILN